MVVISAEGFECHSDDAPLGDWRDCRRHYYDVTLRIHKLRAALRRRQTPRNHRRMLHRFHKAKLRLTSARTIG